MSCYILSFLFLFTHAIMFFLIGLFPPHLSIFQMDSTSTSLFLIRLLSRIPSPILTILSIMLFAKDEHVVCTLMVGFSDRTQKVINGLIKVKHFQGYYKSVSQINLENNISLMNDMTPKNVIKIDWINLKQMQLNGWLGILLLCVMLLAKRIIIHQESRCLF